MKLAHWLLVGGLAISGAAQADLFGNLLRDLQKIDGALLGAKQPSNGDTVPARQTTRSAPQGGQQKDMFAITAELDKETRRGPIGRLRLGYQALADMMAIYPEVLPDRDPRVDYVRKVASVVSMASRTPYFYGGLRVLVVDSEEENAFAAPGGLVLITTGLFNRLESEDELAGVLAHEIAHIELDHSGYEFKAKKSMDAFNQITAQNSGAEGVAMTAFLASNKENMMNGYSAQIESEADARASEIMTEAGYNPYALLRFLERFAGEKAQEIGVKAGETYFAGVAMRKFSGATDSRYAGAKYPQERASLLLRHFRVLNARDSEESPSRKSRFVTIMRR